VREFCFRADRDGLSARRRRTGRNLPFSGQTSGTKSSNPLRSASQSWIFAFSGGKIDSLENLTQRTYDNLDRITQILDANSGATSFSYAATATC
jgi:hypothetical protein